MNTVERWSASMAALVMVRYERLPGWLKFLLIALFWVALSAIFAFHYINAHQAFSSQDEYTYLDYVDKASRGILLRRYMLIDQYTAQELACRGMDSVPYYLPGCGGTIDPENLPIHGFSTGSIHPPVYFWTTAGIAKVLMALNDMTLITAARMSGAVWLGLGIAVLIALLRELGASRSVAFAGGLLMLISPQVWWSNFYVTPDAVNVLAGSLILLTAVRYASGKSSVWWFILASVLMTFIKAQMVFAAAACGIYFVARWLFSERGVRRRSFRAVLWAGVAVVGAMALQFAWQSLRLRMSLPETENSNYTLDPESPFNLEQAIDQSAAFLIRMYQGPISILFNQNYIHAHVTIAALLILAAFFGGVLFPMGQSREDRIFIGSMIVAVICMGPLLYSYIALSGDTAFPLPPRYGGVLLPALFVGLPVAFTEKVPQRILLIAALGFTILAYALNGQG